MRRITFLGAAGTVTGSKYLVEIEKTRFLVDCGLFQGGRELRQRNWAPVALDLSRLDGILLTHAHIDHTGYLPRLVREGYSGPVYCTPPTKALLNYLLPDAGRLQEEEANFANRRGSSRHKPALPLFSEEDANRALKLLQEVPFGQASRVLPSVELSFHRVGHILGAGFIKVEGGGGSILFSGDVGRKNIPILKDPEPILSADTVLLESTYGDRNHGPESPLEAIERITVETVARRGVLLVPAFAVGRTQEILFYLRELQRAKKIPADLPIYVDSPMAVSASVLYRDFHSEHDLETQALEDAHDSPIDGPSVRLMKSVEDSKSLNRVKGPAVIISASGMLSGGRILHHLANRLPDASTTLLFVGYQAEETLGRLILDGAKTARIYGQQYPILARVEQVPALSAHADQTELVEWFSAIPQSPKTLYLVHGEEAARKALSAKIAQAMKLPIVLPALNQSDELG